MFAGFDKTGETVEYETKIKGEALFEGDKRVLIVTDELASGEENLLADLSRSMFYTMINRGYITVTK